MQENRTQARPKTTALRGAVEQQTGIFSKFFLSGVSHKFSVTPEFSHFIAIQSSFLGLKNPFITNFEKRQERNFAGRTHFNYENQHGKWFLQIRIGFEGATNSAVIRNFDNNFGVAGNPQNFTDITTSSGFAFLSQKLNLGEKFFADAALSINFMKYDWQNTFPVVDAGSVNFKPQILPDFGLTWMPVSGFSARFKIGKGNSAPTLEEFRPSNQIINSELHPEYGWNKEIGFRKQFGNFLFLDVSAFDFRLKNAIVRRQNSSGQEYFVNAGGTVQQGFEFVLETKNLKINSSILNGIKLYFSGNFYDFKFENYIQNANDFSGNKMTGVPRKSLQGLVSLQFFKWLNVDYVHYFNDDFALNDANSVYSDKMNLDNITSQINIPLKQKKLSFYFKIQNLYNKELVLGYDINAFGGRYYNPSAKRNYSFGTSFGF